MTTSTNTTPKGRDTTHVGTMTQRSHNSFRLSTTTLLCLTLVACGRNNGDDDSSSTSAGSGGDAESTGTPSLSSGSGGGEGSAGDSASSTSSTSGSESGSTGGSTGSEGETGSSSGTDSSSSGSTSSGTDGSTTGGDSSSTTQGDTGSETDTGNDEECPIPLPGAFTLNQPVWGENPVEFEIPRPQWALAVAHAWALSKDAFDPALGIELTPSFLLATALEESYLGCNADLPEFDLADLGKIVRRPVAYAAGCFQIDSTTGWAEVCRMYPEQIACEMFDYDHMISSVLQEDIGRDNFTSSAFAKLYYDVFAMSMLSHVHGIDAPASWFASATDPQAREKLVAVVYNQGIWSRDVANVLADCVDRPLQECMTWRKDYPVRVSGYAKAFDEEIAGENCYDIELSRQHIIDHARELMPFYGSEVSAAIESAALEVWDANVGIDETAKFQTIVPLLLPEMLAAYEQRPNCPAEQLDQIFVADCPSIR